MTNFDTSKPTAPNSESISIFGELPILSKTLIIFDFDDTLFCTKYFDTFSISYQDIFSFQTSLEEINFCLFKELDDLQKTIIDLFSKLQLNNYDIVIISNADLKWINNVLTHFLEDLKEYISENNIKIFSAKNMFSNLTEKNSNCSEWKIKSFNKVINDFYFQVPENSINLNVISIGDGDDEKKAVFKLNKDNFYLCQNLDKKFIRMISNPSAASIEKQLQFLCENIENIIQNENNKSFKMSIDLVNGCSKVKCLPTKIKNLKKKENKKIEKLECDNVNLLNNSEKNDFLFFDEIDKNYLENENYDNFFGFSKVDDYIIDRNNLFLGRKTINAY